MTKISQLPQDSSPTTTDVVPTVDVEANTTKKSTLASLITLFFDNIPSAVVTPPKWTNPYKFQVYLLSAGVSVANNGIIPFNTEVFDTNSNFDTSTHKYTAPVNGFYYLGATCYVVGEASQPWIGLYKNSSKMSDGMILPNAGSVNCATNIQGVYQLAAGDTVEVRRFNSGGNSRDVYGTLAGLETMFCGYLVSET